MTKEIICKGCNHSYIEGTQSISRYGHGDICTSCGRREAFDGDFISKEKEVTELTIKIHASDNGGWMFDIYNTEEVGEDQEPVDGGLFCGTLAQAAEFAGKVAFDHVKQTQPDESFYGCDECQACEERNAEIIQRIEDMKNNDEKTGEHPNATDEDYQKWATEEFEANQE